MSLLAAAAIFAIQDAEHIVRKAIATTVLAQAVLPLKRIGAQPRFIPRPARGTAAGIHAQLVFLNAKFAKDVRPEGDEFRVLGGRRVTEDLYAGLVVLAKAAGLRAVIAKDRPEVEQLLAASLGVEAMIDEGPHDRCGALWPQGKLTAALIGKLVHLFGDDIRAQTQRALEQFAHLKHRGADFSKAVPLKHISDCGFGLYPAGGLSRENVLSPPDGFDSQRLSLILYSSPLLRCSGTYLLFSLLLNL